MDANDDLPAARGRIRKNALLLGSLDGPALHTLAPEQIRTACLEKLALIREDDRYIPFATGTDVELTTPRENLGALRQAVEEDASG